MKTEDKKIIEFKPNAESAQLSETSKKEKVNFKKILIISVFIIAFAYPLLYIGTQKLSIEKYKDEVTELETTIKKNEEIAKNISDEIENSASEEFIEKMARENLKMVKKDEIVYVKID